MSNWPSTRSNVAHHRPTGGPSWRWNPAWRARPAARRTRGAARAGATGSIIPPASQVHALPISRGPELGRRRGRPRTQAVYAPRADPSAHAARCRTGNAVGDPPARRATAGRATSTMLSKRLAASRAWIGNPSSSSRSAAIALQRMVGAGGRDSRAAKRHHDESRGRRPRR